MVMMMRENSSIMEVMYAARQVWKHGWNHTNYEGCLDRYPSPADVEDIPEDVECEACLAAVLLDRAIRAGEWQ